MAIWRWRGSSTGRSPASPRPAGGAGSPEPGFPIGRIHLECQAEEEVRDGAVAGSRRPPAPVQQPGYIALIGIALAAIGRHPPHVLLRVLCRLPGTWKTQQP